MPSARDDFAAGVKREIANRVGARCSNPNCRCPTAGPKAGSGGTVSIGVAAHITAAAKGGPRYDLKLSAQDRASLSNAIWLCQNCATLVDRDPSLYEAGLLRAWKDLSEAAAQLALGARDASPFGDKDIIQFFTVCLDRPAFQDVFYQERSTEQFDKAIEDTITAFNTGTLRARDGVVLQTNRGKSYLRDAETRGIVDAIVDILRAIRGRYAEAKRSGEITVVGRGYGETAYCVNDSHLAQWFDDNRIQILTLFKRVADSVGVSYALPTREMWLMRDTRPRR